jgi:2-keto-4-pentenoate hydratase/2-oxohepta-3-ene-1,7-dioic acid hydratase in catechol pathway
MQLATVAAGDRSEVAVAIHATRGVALLSEVVPGFRGDLMALLTDSRLADVADAVESARDDAFRDITDVDFVAPYRRPRKIWGIGLNYVEHAHDLAATVPDEPASFMKGDHTIIGPGDPIPLPSQSRRTTAEAELGLVIGRECYDVDESAALDYVAGFCPVLDQTAEDILERNPRFLTRSKNFPGFFSFGPRIVPLNEVVAHWGSLAAVEVSTVINGAVHKSNVVANMRFDPAFLISFHSKVMPLFPGDIICTGTPGAVHIRPGDVVECRIPGVGILANPVVTGR